jgi:hypothetical protein
MLWNDAITAGICDRRLRFRFKLHGNNFEPPMSALGHKRTLSEVYAMSALPQMQTFVAATGMSALCQKQTFCAAAKMSIFDHLVGYGERRLTRSPHRREQGLTV